MVSYQWAAAASSSRPQAAAHGAVYVDGDPAAAAYPYGGSPTTNLAHHPAGASLSDESPTSLPLSSFASAGDRAGHAHAAQHGPYRTDGRLSSANSSSTASSSGVQAVKDSPPMEACTSASQH